MAEYAGLTMPPEFVAGRWQLVSGEEQFDKLVSIAVRERNSRSPWCVAGSNQPVFEAGLDKCLARVRAQIERHFSRWERQGRARLVSVTGSFGDGVLNVLVTYVYLPKSQQRSVPVALGAGA